MLDTLQQLDTQVLNFMRSWIDPQNHTVVSAIHAGADIQVIFTMLLLVAFWLYGAYAKDNQYKKDALSIFSYIAVGFSLYMFISLFITGRTRPEVVAAIRPLIDHIPDNSFPSGHATFAAASLFGLALTSHKKTFYFALLLAAIMLLCRIFAGVHYPGDILAGIILGYAISCMVKAYIIATPAYIKYFETPVLRLAAFFRL